MPAWVTLCNDSVSWVVSQSRKGLTMLNDYMLIPWLETSLKPLSAGSFELISASRHHPAPSDTSPDSTSTIVHRCGPLSRLRLHGKAATFPRAASALTSDLAGMGAGVESGVATKSTVEAVDGDHKRRLDGWPAHTSTFSEG